MDFSLPDLLNSPFGDKTPIDVCLMMSLALVGAHSNLVIKAIVSLEFEDGLRTGVLPGGCWYPCGGCTYPRINSAPTGRVRVGHKGGVVVKRTHVRPNSDSAEFHAWVVLNYSSYVVLE